MKSRFTRLFYGLFCLLFVFFGTVAWGQSLIWEKTFGGANIDVSTQIIKNPAGGYYISGASNSTDGDIQTNNGSADIWITSINEDGNLLWSKSFGGTNVDVANSLTLTADGNLVICGSSDSDDVDIPQNKGQEDLLVMKISTSGNILWVKTYGGEDKEEGIKIIEVENENLVIVGYTESTTGDISMNLGDRDAWIVKLDKNGNLLWEKAFGTNGTDIGNGIVMDENGDYVIVGIDEDVNNQNKNIAFLLKLSSNGELIWKKNYGNPNFMEEAFAVEVLPSNKYIVWGSTSDIFDNGFDSFWLFEVNETGNLLRQQGLFIPGQFENLVDYVPRGLSKTFDNGLIASGYIESSLEGMPESSYVFTKIDLSTFSFQWVGLRGGTSADRVFSVNTNSDGTFVLAGLTYSDDGDISTNRGLSDSWILKLNDDNFSLIDFDNDLFDVTVDCDDTNPNINPSVPEIPNNGVDDNCNGEIDETNPQDNCNTPTDLILTTQAEVNAFAMSCNILNGNLIINGDDITNLTPLLSLQQINGNVSIGDSLTIPSNDILQTLEGLNNIRTITGDLTICNNPMLRSLSGFSSLEEVGGNINVKNCQVLETWSMISLRRCGGYCYISNCASFVSFNCPAFVFIGGTFRVSDCNVFIEWALSNLGYIGGDFYTINCPALPRIELPRLITLLGCFHVINNVLIQDLDGLDSLQTIGESIYIIDNDHITDLDLMNLQTINGSLVIADNDNLTNLNGLMTLTHVADSLVITNNMSLNNCCGIYDLLNTNGVGGFINISGNPAECSSENEVLETCPEPPICEFDNPLIDLDWLANIVANIDPCITSIRQTELDGEIVFVLDYEDICEVEEGIFLATELIFVIYDCEGNIICSEGFVAEPCGFAPPTGITIWTPECICTQEYNPVCVGDTTYSNPCFAACDGFTEYIFGNCHPLDTCNNLTNGGEICCAQTLCGDNLNPEPFSSVSLPSGGAVDSLIEYLWIYTLLDPAEQEFIEWEVYGNSNSPELDLDEITQTVWLRRCSRRAGCHDYLAESNIIKITVLEECATNCDDFNIAMTLQDESCFGSEDGAISLIAQGGALPYSFVWSNGAITGSISNLSAGTYSVTVMDANGCSFNTSATVQSPEALTVSSNSSPETCDFNDGSIDLSISGGSGDYNYIWSNGSTSEDLTGLVAGDYSVTVTDALSGCFTIFNETVFLADCPPPACEDYTLEITNISSIDCDGNLGAIDLTFSSLAGDMPAVDFVWNDGATTQDRTDLVAGIYSVSISFENCTYNADITLNEPDCGLNCEDYSLEVVHISPIDCEGNLGAIEMNFTDDQGLTLDVNYLWSDGATTKNRENLTAGIYTVWVILENCTYSAEITLTEPNCGLDCDGFSLEITNITPVDCDGNLGTIDLTFTDSLGETPAVDFVWNDGATTEDRTDLVAGIYSVTVVLENCTYTAEVTLSAPNCAENEDTVVTCNDGIDNDLDGLVDCDDPDCDVICLVNQDPDFQFLNTTADVLNNSSVRLRWTTLGEEENGYHIVRHSLDSLQFSTKSDIMDSKGISNETHSYEWTDETPHAGMNYYHIRHIDGNGHSYFSVLMSAYIATSNGAVLYPNPMENETILDFIEPLKEDATVKVYDNYGHLMQDLVIPTGTARYQMDVTDLPTGVYHLHLNKPTKRAKVLPLIKMRF